MKTSLGIAIMAVCASHAHAQSNVTIYGTIDGGLRYVDQAGTTAATAGDGKLGFGTRTLNRWGVRGVEDLGGGLNVHFNLESGYSAATGALDNTNNVLFRRAALVGLGGSWGSLDFGRQTSVANKTALGYDPFGFRYLGIINIASSTVGPVRLDNDMQYAGTFGPWTVRAEYALGEQVGSATNGATAALGLAYTHGPFSIGGAYTAQKANAGTLAAPSFQDRKQFLVGSAYKIGATRIAGGYLDDKIPTAATGLLRTKSIWLGASHDISPNVVLTAAYYQTTSSSLAGDGKKRLYIAGVTYALSKRSHLYAEIDLAQYRGRYAGVLPAPAGQAAQRGFSLGVGHAF
jgi:predicted porin